MRSVKNKKLKMKKQKQKQKSNETEIIVLLDKSGSMSSIGAATVEGFNKFLNEQQNAEGEATMTLVQFDDRYELNYQSINVKNISPLIYGESYSPRGSTSLFDAIGKTIEEVKTNKDVIFVIITDGEENSSRTYKKEAIFNMIENLKKEEGWNFVFLAANQDAMAAGSSIGISKGSSINYSATSAGAGAAFSTMSANTALYRSAKFSGEIGETLCASLDFTDDQREETMKSTT